MILCCGEALIDMIPEQTQTGTMGFVPHAGGAVFNTAIALGRLGANVGMLTALSKDMFGEKLLSDLHKSKVDTAHIQRSDNRSTLAFVQLVDGQAKYAFFDENSAERQMIAAGLPQIAPSVSALYFGGISLAREPGGEVYAQLAQRAHADRAVMLDPNIRPGFVENEAAYRARISNLIACADIVKVSDEDLNWLDQDSRSVDEKAARMQGDKGRIVILTRGADGATAWLPDGSQTHVASEKADVVDTVGAGDTFNAGVLASLSDQGLLHKDKLRDITAEQMKGALAFGGKVAAVTVSRAGANSPWRHELI